MCVHDDGEKLEKYHYQVVAVAAVVVVVVVAELSGPAAPQSSSGVGTQMAIKSRAHTTRLLPNARLAACVKTRAAGVSWIGGKA